MDYKNLQGAFVRRQEIVCTEAEASIYGSAVLLEGEPIYIKMNDGSTAQKLGDGKTKLKDLPFTDFGKEKVEAAAEAALAEIAEAKGDLLGDIAIAGSIVQTTGTSETAVMSQKAVSAELAKITNTLTQEGAKWEE
jgi:hypothetical protein